MSFTRDTKRERPKRKFSGERKGPLYFSIKEEDKANINIVSLMMFVIELLIFKRKIMIS